jgi:hypothetical protein
MAQPVWQTPAGSLGVIPEGIFFSQVLEATDPDAGSVTYQVIAGTLPPGVQLTANGQISGVPQATSTIQGVPTPVNRDVTSKFVIRARALTRIADRTFTLTVTGNDAPQFVTPAGSIGTFYDGDRVDVTVEYTENDPGDVTVVRLIAGELPPGLSLSAAGVITGYIEPATPYDQTPGNDETPYGVEPYDFVVEFQSRNYQFTLEVTDGKTSDLRTFTMFVYARNELTADNTTITADNSVITADETNTRAPFLVNAAPSDLGAVRSDNYFAYQFIGEDYDTADISYAISVNQGFGLPPGLTLDPSTGWYYGEIPDQGTTEVTYSFNITVYQTESVQAPVSCIATSAATNRITCVSTAPLVGPDDWFIAGDEPLYIPIKLSGTALGGLSTAGEILYYVAYVYSATEFSIVDSPTSTDLVNLSTSAGSMTASVVITSEPFPFTLTLTGAIDTEITWLTDSDLGTLVNGETSLLRVEAVNRGGRDLEYRLRPGAFNELPQGLQLLPSGDIAGRVTFNTFAIDLGATIIDDNTTTFDSAYVFTAEAYAPDTQQTLYNVAEIQVVAGGSGYSRSSPPTIVFQAPIGASAVRALAGNVTIGFDSTIAQAARSSLNVATIVTNEPHQLTDGAGVSIIDCSLAGFDVVGATIGNVTATSFTYTNAGATVSLQSATGNVQSGSGITAVAVADPGAGYVSTAGNIITITDGFGGTGANLQAVMQATGTRDVISTFKEFTITLIREYDAPYQNLYVVAMPPQQDRELLSELLDNQEIFVPDYIFRATDPNFGLSTQVRYQHAFGLAPDALDVYVESLYLNHYWKNLVLGQVETAIARDANDNIIYEVVYSRIIDDLVNNQGESVAKIEPLAYAITDPGDGSSVLNVVYPNSLDNMRDQVIDTVGQISTGLPLWMTSKQADGRVLGFTPAWVICYAKPGRARQIAYYLANEFGEQLNKIDFKVDRYVLDRALSLNWDTGTQDWTPQPNLTTFDRFNTSQFTFLQSVDIGTNLAYSDVSGRTLQEVNDLGGFDGIINQVDGNTIVFVKQENYNGPPGSSYPDADSAWEDPVVTFDSEPFDATGTSFDEAKTISGGVILECDETAAGTNIITYVNVTDVALVYEDLPVIITGTVAGTGLATGVHVVTSAPTKDTFTVAKASWVTNTQADTDLITVSDSAGLSVNDTITFFQTPFGGLVPGVTYHILTVTSIGGGAAQITVSLSSGGVRETLTTAAGLCLLRRTSDVTLNSVSGITGLTVETFNERMAVWTIAVGSGGVLGLSIKTQTQDPTPLSVSPPYLPFVSVTRGQQYISAQLYRPVLPGTGFTRVSWLAVPTIVTDETTFDQGSVDFVEPVDMYNPGETNDKYLVFPKTNILV